MARSKKRSAERRGDRRVSSKHAGVDAKDAGGLRGDAGDVEPVAGRRCGLQRELDMGNGGG